MHEFAIVEALIEQVRREVDRAGHSGRVMLLELAVGRLSGVHCDALRFAFDLLSRGTLAEKAELKIARPKATCRCRTCHAKVEIEDLLVRCPQCDSKQIVIEGGRELLLQSIEIED